MSVRWLRLGTEIKRFLCGPAKQYSLAVTIIVIIVLRKFWLRKASWLSSNIRIFFKIIEMTVLWALSS